MRGGSVAVGMLSRLWRLLLGFNTSEENKTTETQPGRPQYNPTQTPKNNSMAIVCATHSGDQDDQYVDEWAQYHRLLGFNEIHLFPTQASASETLQRLGRDSSGFLTVHPPERKYLTAYFKCSKPYTRKHVWAAFLGIDEFIVLRKHLTIQALLAEVLPEGGALSLNRYLFGSNGHKSASSEPVLSRFTNRSATLDHRVKTISYLPVTRRIYKHYTVVKEPFQRVDVTRRNLGSSRNYNKYPTDSLAVIHHYHRKSEAEFQSGARRRRLNGAAAPEPENSDAHKGADPNLSLLFAGPDAQDFMFSSLDENANQVRDESAVSFFLQRLHHEKQRGVLRRLPRNT
jgi:hypothetical protein